MATVSDEFKKTVCLIGIKVVTQHAAFNMFRAWTKKAKKRFPEMDFTIKDETCLVKDFKGAVQKAVKSLFEPEYDEVRKVSESSVRFVCAVTEQILSRQWYFDYIQVRGDEYKEVCALNSILAYLEDEEPFSYKMDSLYKENLRKVNLKNITIKPEPNPDDKQEARLSPVHKRIGLVEQVVKNRIWQIIETLSDKDTPFITVSLADCISEMEVRFMIDFYSLLGCNGEAPLATPPPPY
jgi:hypothetical protein